ncbi:alpha/beta hydrolase family protein [Gaetbulibacter aestuarii]|uniref:Alpha/beta fold hydrolase n=1 Tax=Gaetbulibacter aestuarii TaxID=1502358 RepID=A0ABW7MWX9_9FLAO
MRGFLFKIIFLLSFTVVFSQAKRPQTPEAPFNYTSDTVHFKNPKANNITFEGTLTIPKNIKNPPVAILITGSGPQDRNETVKQFNHSPFLVLADYLSRHGIAVLRYDDRGVGNSEGDFSTGTSYDFATDAEAAFTFLKQRTDIDTSAIGLIGHSEGGLIAPMVASKNKDVAFVVLLAGPGVDGAEILRSQAKKVGMLSGVPQIQLDENDTLSKTIYEVIKTTKNEDSIAARVTRGLNDYKAKNPMSVLAPYITPVMIEQQLKTLKSPWIKAFIRIDPKDYLQETTCPVLALNGSKDVQVLADLNLEGIKAGLEKAQNTDVTIKALEGLNHLFQTAETGMPQEYSKIEETFSPNALEIISNWILERFH